MNTESPKKAALEIGQEQRSKLYGVLNELDLRVSALEGFQFLFMAESTEDKGQDAICSLVRLVVDSLQEAAGQVRDAVCGLVKEG